MKEGEIRVVVVWGCIRVEGYLCNAYIYIKTNSMKTRHSSS